MEKAVLDRMLAFYDKAKLLPFFQSACRKIHSCETALVRIYNEALWAMEEQNVMPLMAIDLSAAFDTVDHRVLLSDLQKECGTGGDALRWCDTYLRPRNMQVHINKEHSLPRPLTFSVTQGSVLGPQMFRNRIIFKVMIFMFKIAPACLCNLIQSARPTRQLRSSRDDKKTCSP